MAGVLANNLEKLLGGAKVGKWLSVGLTLVATFLAVLCPAFVPYYLTALAGTAVSLLGGGIIAGLGHNTAFWSGFAEFVNQEAPSFAISMSRNETQEWYHVFVGGEEIIRTAEHPCFMVGKGFVPARD